MTIDAQQAQQNLTAPILLPRNYYDPSKKIVNRQSSIVNQFSAGLDTAKGCHYIRFRVRHSGMLYAWDVGASGIREWKSEEWTKRI
jgi:hypothetical protein